MHREIEIFYDQYVHRSYPDDQFFLGHFDVLHWEDLKKDLSACERLQRKPFYKIALLNGTAKYHSNNVEVPISGYTIVFTEPMTRSSFSTDDENFVGDYCVCSESFLRGTAKLNLRNWPVFKDQEIYAQPLSKEQYLFLSQIMLEIEQEKDSDYFFKEQLIRNRVFDIIHYIQKSIKSNNFPSLYMEDTLDERFLKLVENVFFDISLQKPLVGKTPAYFAGLLNTTVDHLNQTLKKITGKTTRDVLHERIIEEANILLKHTNYSVKEIAWCLNFQETPHFVNFYKKLTKTTPLVYRTT